MTKLTFEKKMLEKRANTKIQKAFINGEIYTVNELQPYAEAVIIDQNKIIWVGSNAGAEKLIDGNIEVIDLKGKLMLPGFIDTHTHFINGGFHLTGLDLSQTKSTKEFTTALKKFVEGHKGKWITGGNWNHEAWETKALPYKEMIDDFTKDTPVFIERLDKHMGLANSFALKLAGITKDTPSPEGGLIEKNHVNGLPTGIIKDNAMPLIYSKIPSPSEEEMYNAGLAALNEARRNGITSIQDITYPNDFSIYQMLEKNNELTCRIYARLPIASYKNLVDAGIHFNFGSDKLKLGSLKAFSDGSLGAGTAWFFNSYLDDKNNYGLPNDILTDGRLEQWALDADKNKLQLSIHAIGDKANAAIIDLFEKIERLNPNWERRFRIEHAQHIRKKDIQRLAGLNAIVSAQPYHLVDDGAWAEKKIGTDRINETYSFKSFLDAGVKLCFGSDWTVAPLNVILGIHAAVTRKTIDGKNQDGWIPEQKISVEEAIRAYTITAAYASFEENIKGSIEPGKLADLVVLNDDILSIEADKIKDAKVEMTIFDGEIIYRA